MNQKDIDEIAVSLKAVKEAQKNKPKENYRVVLVNLVDANSRQFGYKPKTVEYFYAKDDVAAADFIKQYKEKNKSKLPESYEYFWKYANTTIGSNGKYYDDVMDDLVDYRENRSIWQAISTWWYVHVSSKLSDIKYWFADLFYWLKTKHNRKESWEIFSSILGILEHNIPILIEKHVGVPTRYCIEARKLLHKKDKNFDLEASLRKNPNSDDEELKLASKLYEDDLSRLLLNVRLFNYYESFGIFDENNPNEVAISEQHKIPYKKGSWKEIDYVKLEKLTSICNNAIFNQLKDIGRCLWD